MQHSATLCFNYLIMKIQLNPVNTDFLFDLLTIGETCEILRVDRVTLWRIRKRKELVGLKIGGKLFFTKECLINYIKRDLEGEDNG